MGYTREGSTNNTMDEQLAQDCMTLILNSGEGKALATEAFGLLMNQHDKEGAENKLKEAGNVIGLAHEIQTRLMQAEINGENIEKSILLIHAQDHFMTAVTFRDMVKMMMEMYEKLYSE
jgi:cellobiose PTS system EIIA component